MVSNKYIRKELRPFVEKGKKQSQLFEEQIEQALNIKQLKATPKRNHYIVGGPGIGKTFTVNQIAKKYGIKLRHIQGAVSMSAFCIELATASYLRNGEPFVVWIDDCDSIFSNSDSLSIMKGVLDEERNIFAWNKNMGNVISHMNNKPGKEHKNIAKALQYYSPADSVGIQFPTDNMRFIITTNHSLAASNPLPKTAKRINEAALRDRVVYRDLNLNKELSWGWLAHAASNAKLFDLTDQVKGDLLNWVYDHWEKLPSVSHRFVNELAADVLNFPEDYKLQWETRIIR